MPAATESSTMAEHMRLRGPRKPTSILSTDPRHPHSNSTHPMIQSTTCKSSISSLLLSTFTNSHNPESSGSIRASSGHVNDNRKKGFRNSGLRGFGCTAQPEVTVPAPAAMIRSSADWREKGERKSKKKKKKKQKDGGRKERESLLEMQDVWCGPGIGFCSDDFIAPMRPVSSRGKIDVDEIHHRERPSYVQRQRLNVDNFPDLDEESALEYPRFGSDVFEARYYHHLRNRSPEGLSEIVMFQSRLFMGARSYAMDRHREMRLDIENMSYEELLELGDRIGYVSTGLKVDELGNCIRKTKLSSSSSSSLDDDTASHSPTETDRKCSICQEEYERDDEIGRLECSHVYHIQCIKQWLARRNACPVCKAEASVN
ncbi:hypothetical protein V2J09_019367 [Rumex salicifolius]